MHCITPGVISFEQNWPSFHGTFKLHQFSREEFHYLNVTRVGIFTYYDLLDCIFECVRNTLCLSINMAAFEGADGKLWCELLSSDKYRNAENFKENISWHHFSIMVRMIFRLFFSMEMKSNFTPIKAPKSECICVTTPF